MLARTDDDFALAHGFCLDSAYTHKYFPSVEGIRFFPKHSWRGSQIAIYGWSSRHPDRPVLNCVVWRDWINPAKWFGMEGVKVQQIDTVELMELCGGLGWNYDINDNIGYRYCTIDELELIEGPPPEGAF